MVKHLSPSFIIVRTLPNIAESGMRIIRDLKQFN